jgi:hypothetical protein
MDDCPDDDDDTPALTDGNVIEVLSLLQTALGDRITDDPPLDGDVNLILETALEHTIRDQHVIWIANTSINVALCAHCGSVSVCAVAPTLNSIHGCIEIMERLRVGDTLGGSPDGMVCTYRRIPLLGDYSYAYVFAGTFWLDFDDVSDRVFHTTRSLVGVVDEVTRIVDNSVKNRRQRN